MGKVLRVIFMIPPTGNPSTPIPASLELTGGIFEGVLSAPSTLEAPPSVPEGIFFKASFRGFLGSIKEAEAGREASDPPLVSNIRYASSDEPSNR